MDSVLGLRGACNKTLAKQLRKYSCVFGVLRSLHRFATHIDIVEVVIPRTSRAKCGLAIPIGRECVTKLNATVLRALIHKFSLSSVQPE